VAISLAVVLCATAHAELRVDSALRKASHDGDIPEMQRQLDLGAEPNRAYALVSAVDGDQFEAVKFLLAHGADPNAWTTINIRVPVGAAYSPVFVAATHRNREILSYLKTHGADFNAESVSPSASSLTALSAAIDAGDLIGTQLLIEYGADVNHRCRRGEMPLMLAVYAAKNKLEIFKLLLSHGADPDVKNAEGVSTRERVRPIADYRALVELAKPTQPSDLPPENLPTVASALHYKALCDAGLPGYEQREARDYALWRASQAKAIAQLESSVEFQKQQAAAKEFFASKHAQAADDELQEHREALHRICEVGLVAQFRTGEPAYEAAEPAVPANLLQPAAATVKSMSQVHKSAPAPVAAGMRQPPP
jgi:hypothetical protein